MYNLRGFMTQVTSHFINTTVTTSNVD